MLATRALLWFLIAVLAGDATILPHNPVKTTSENCLATTVQAPFGVHLEYACFDAL
jgi:hypothetical protein